jgi:hypothetical protein
LKFKRFVVSGVSVQDSAPPLAASVQFNRKKKLQHDKCRMSIDECRIKEFFLFYLLKIAERSDIHNSSIDKVSYERRRWPKKRPV